MGRWTTSCLTCISAAALLGLAGCGRYRHMRRVAADDGCLDLFRPRIERTLYRTSVDVVGKHLSGLLLIRRMPDSSVRLVFTGETGFGFFDFSFRPDDSFRVYSILPQLNKKAVIKTLRKDFELVLFRKMSRQNRFTLRDSARNYYGYPQVKGVNYYVTDTLCRQLLVMQRASRRKPVMEAVTWLGPDNEPDSISVRHLNFSFHIELKKIPTGE